MYFKIRWLNQSRDIANVYGSGQTPWRVDKLHVVFDRFTTDDILKFHTLHFVTRWVLEVLRENQFTGLGICHLVEIDYTRQYWSMYSEAISQDYYILTVEGAAGHDDIGINRDGELVVSRNVLSVLSRLNICEVELEELEIFLRKKYRSG